MIEQTRVAKWLYQRLKADSTLTALIGGPTNPRIYQELAPTAAAHPLIVVSHLASIDTNVLDANRVLTQSLWLVRAISQGASFEALQSIADRIDLLHDTAGTQGGVTIAECVREETFMQAETQEGSAPGVQWRHLGGRFRIFAHAT